MSSFGESVRKVRKMPRSLVWDWQRKRDFHRPDGLPVQRLLVRRLSGGVPDAGPRRPANSPALIGLRNSPSAPSAWPTAQGKRVASGREPRRPFDVVDSDIWQPSLDIYHSRCAWRVSVAGKWLEGKDLLAGEVCDRPARPRRPSPGRKKKRRATAVSSSGIWGWSGWSATV